MFDQPLQQVRRAKVVHRCVMRDLIHALAHANARGEMKNRVHTVQRLLERIRVTHITANKFHIRMQIRGSRPRCAVHLVGKIVEDTNVKAVCDQVICEM